MRILLASLLLVELLVPAAAQAHKFPRSANLLDATKPEFGAIPNDGLDDYPAIKIAMGFVDGFGGNTLYFPCGTYNFHETVEWRDWPTILNPSVQVSQFVTSADGTVSGYLWTIGMPWVGEDRDCVVIKLDDNSPGFGDPAHPKSFLQTGSLVGPSSNQKGLTGGAGGAGGYQNFFEDLTIDCGSGNPGARCLDWIASNAGEVRRVKIRSGDGQGQVGLYLGRTWPGPCLVMDTIIEGFNYGIQILQNQYSITFFRNTLTNQHTAGVYLASNMATFDKLSISESEDIPAINQADGSAQLAVLNGNLSGPVGATHSAIETHASAKFHFEDLDTSGYAHAVTKGTTVIAATGHVDQADSNVPYKLYNAPDKSLNLPLVEPPDPFTSDPDVHPEDWANVVDYGAGPGFGGETTNDVPFIQAAMNSGKPIVYFPKFPVRSVNPTLPAGLDSTFTFAGPTITVPGTVRRVLFFRNTMFFKASAYPNASDCVFTVVGNADDPPVEFNYLRRGGDVIAPAKHICNHSNGRTVVIRNSPSSLFFDFAGPGENFVIDTISAFNASGGAHVYAWQYDQERDTRNGSIAPGSFVDGVGTTVRIVGMKTEGDFTTARITNGALYKMIGGFYFPCIGRTIPNSVLSDGFEIVDAQASLSFLEYCGKNPSSPGYVWSSAVTQTVGDTTRALRSDQIIFSLSCCSNRNYAPLFNALPSDLVIRPEIEDAPTSVTVPSGPLFLSYKLAEIDPAGVHGVPADPGMWTQPASCQGMKDATFTVTKDETATGNLDVDLYSCQDMIGGPKVGLFDPKAPWTALDPKNCRLLTGDVILDGVGIDPGTATDFTYSGAMGKMVARIVRCDGNCSAQLTLQCSRN